MAGTGNFGKTAFDIQPGSDDVYYGKTGAWDKRASGPNYSPNMAYIGSSGLSATL